MRSLSTVIANLSLLKNPRLWLILLCALQFLSALYYLPPDQISSNIPVAIFDHTAHLSEGSAIVQLFEQGHNWGYDPHFMAGYPVGTVFDVDNKLVEVFMYALSGIGVAAAYNLFWLLLFVALPLFIFLAARNFGLNAWQQLAAVTFAMLVWQLDPLAHSMWYLGLFTFAAVSYLSPWLVSVFYIYLREGTRMRWALLAVVTPLIFLLHPLAFFTLLIPIVIIYVWHARRIPLRRHLALLAIPLLILAVNAYWLITLWQFQNTVTNTAQFLRGGIQRFSGDVIELFAGFPLARSLAIRWDVLMLGGIGIALWWRQRARGLAFVFAVTAFALLATAYFAREVPGGAAFEPYRFIVPALFFLVFPAAAFLGEPKLWEALRQASRWQVLAFAALLLLAFPQLARAFYDQEPQLARFWSDVAEEDRLIGPDARQGGLLNWIAKNTSANGRILIQDWVTGALIPYFDDREVIGGPYFPYFTQYGFANVGWDTAFDGAIKDFSTSGLNKYLQSYNVQWIIVDTVRIPETSYGFNSYVKDKHPSFLTLVTKVNGYEIYHVNNPPNYFLTGSGRVTAALNTLQVQGATPGGIVLEYHWLATLKTNPPLPIERYPVLRDPIGFIRVENGDVSNFVIYNGY